MEVLVAGVLTEVTLHGREGVRVSGFSLPARVSLPFGDTEPIMMGIGDTQDIFGRNLWDLERAEADVCADLNNHVVALGARHSVELIHLLIVQLHF